MKTCNKCKKNLADDRFGVSYVRGKSYVRHVCKTCTQNAWREKQPAAPRPPQPAVDAHAAGPVAVEKRDPAPVLGSPDPVQPAPEPDFEITEDPVAVAVARVEERTAKVDLAREHKALVAELKQKDRLIAELGKLNLPPEIIVYDKPVWERADAVACALASDWHVEEPVIAATVHGRNEYNLEIAKYRSALYFKHLLRLAEIQARDSKINSIWIGFLGDFFSGWIHEELLASCLLAPGEAALLVKSLLVNGIQYLLDNSSFNIEGDLLPGNHGRMTKRVHSGDPTGTSLETAMYQHVADWFRSEPRVRLRVASQSMVYRRFFERFNMRMVHGYEVNYGGGVGGLTIPLKKKLAKWDSVIRADLTVLGHFHQFFDGGNFMVNGSLIGYNTYAQIIGAEFEAPRQAFFVVHARNGGEKSVVAPIWLDEAHKARS